MLLHSPSFLRTGTIRNMIKLITKSRATIDKVSIKVLNRCLECNWCLLCCRPLPTWESEWLHRNDPVWEYGFYEPPEEKIPKGKLMFREALEVVSLLRTAAD